MTQTTRCNLAALLTQYTFVALPHFDGTVNTVNSGIPHFMHDRAVQQPQTRYEWQSGLLVSTPGFFIFFHLLVKRLLIKMRFRTPSFVPVFSFSITHI